MVISQRKADGKELFWHRLSSTECTGNALHLALEISCHYTVWCFLTLHSPPVWLPMALVLQETERANCTYLISCARKKNIAKKGLRNKKIYLKWICYAQKDAHSSKESGWEGTYFGTERSAFLSWSFASGHNRVGCFLTLRPPPYDFTWAWCYKKNEKEKCAYMI